MQSAPLTPGGYWDIVKRRKWSLILTSLLVLGIAAAVAFFLPAVYESYATIMIEEQQIPSDFVMTTVNSYAEQRVENIKQRVTETSEFLADEAGRIQVELSAFESEVAEFKKQHINELPELFQVNKQSLDAIERTVERLSSELRALNEREGHLVVQLASLSPYVKTTLERNRDEEMLKNLKLQLASLRQRYTDEYPDIASLRAQLAELQRRVAAAPPAGPSSTGDKQPDNPAYVTLNSQLASTRADIQALEKQIERFHMMRN